MLPELLAWAYAVRMGLTRAIHADHALWGSLRHAVKLAGVEEGTGEDGGGEGGRVCFPSS